MLHWFEAVAPIRQKMLVVAWSLTGLCLVTGLTATALGGYAGAAAVLVGSAAAFGLSMMLRTRICTPYVNTVARMETLAEGDLDSAIAYTDYADCVGRMTKAMFKFRALTLSRMEERDAVHRIVQLLNAHLHRLADGDLTVFIEEEVGDDYASLKENFNSASHALGRLIGRVGEATVTIKSGSVEIAGAAESLADRTQSSAAAMEQTTASLTSIDGRIKASSEAAMNAVDRVNEARRVVETSHHQVATAVDAMAKVADSAKAIDGVIEGLDKIAFQTRVLAMNAAVESGRAGEAGRGFAVVADLVSQLASRSEEEARRARGQIQETQDRISSSVGQVQGMNGALDLILSSVADVEALVTQIANDNATQATAVTQILVAVGDMDRSIQQNAAMVEETSAAAKSLSNEVSDLQQHASAFTVDAPRNAPPPFVQRAKPPRLVAA
ncbi:methyl-accepting chemotaxis protein [Sphingomonas sp. UYP23]